MSNKQKQNKDFQNFQDGSFYSVIGHNTVEAQS